MGFESAQKALDMYMKILRRYVNIPEIPPNVLSAGGTLVLTITLSHMLIEWTLRKTMTGIKESEKITGIAGMIYIPSIFVNTVAGYFGPIPGITAFATTSLLVPGAVGYAIRRNEMKKEEPAEKPIPVAKKEEEVVIDTSTVIQLGGKKETESKEEKQKPPEKRAAQREEKKQETKEESVDVPKLLEDTAVKVLDEEGGQEVQKKEEKHVESMEKTEEEKTEEKTGIVGIIASLLSKKEKPATRKVKRVKTRVKIEEVKIEEIPVEKKDEKEDEKEKKEGTTKTAPPKEEERKEEQEETPATPAITMGKNDVEEFRKVLQDIKRKYVLKGASEGPKVEPHAEKGAGKKKEKEGKTAEYDKTVYKRVLQRVANILFERKKAELIRPTWREVRNAKKEAEKEAETYRERIILEIQGVSGKLSSDDIDRIAKRVLGIPVEEKTKEEKREEPKEHRRKKKEEGKKGGSEEEDIEALLGGGTEEEKEEELGELADLLGGEEGEAEEEDIESLLKDL